MTDSSDQDQPTIRTLATDLDGTLIPLPGLEQNQADLALLSAQLTAHQIELVYVTGRHLELIDEAVQEHSLPPPNWIIADVGTSLYQRIDQDDASLHSASLHSASSNCASSNSASLHGASSPFHLVNAYFETLGGQETADRIDIARHTLAAHPKLRLQEAAKQNRLKASFYTDAGELETISAEIQSKLQHERIDLEMIASVDPFTGDGLIDIIPLGASKQFALEWWRINQQRDIHSILFAGDSGNDWHAFTAGYQTVVVANTDRSLARRVYDWHAQNGWQNRLLLATQPATSGVLEACRWFEWLPQPSRLTAEGLGVIPRSVNCSSARVWAPKQAQIEIVVNHDGDDRPASRTKLVRHQDGYHSGHAPLRPGDKYSLHTSTGALRPDPTSRWQPEGVHGPSMVIDAQHFPWQDHDWQGVPTDQLMIYELHVGTFTHEGTYRAIESQLEYFLKLGVNAIELMPLAQTPGNWNWGYDGVHLFAPRSSYGTPDELRSLVDACHRHGLSVILDVVYNHLGPEGNYLSEFGPYFSRKYHTPWGESFAFDAAKSNPVRDFVISNAIYWLRDFHIDGLRLDAVHFMFDKSETHILEEIRQRVADESTRWDRHIHLIAETNVLDTTLNSNANNVDLEWTVWCDDLMHAAHSMVASHETFPHRKYEGAEDFADALRQGFLYAGSHPDEYERVTINTSEDARDRVASDVSLLPFVIGLQNHDKVGNHPLGQRIHQLSSPEAQRTLAAMFLLYPAIPQIFMGEETAGPNPFYFFADFEDARLRQAVDRGRKREYPHAQWDIALPPSHPDAFLQSVLTRDGDQDRMSDACEPSMFRWYQRLLEIRRQWRSLSILRANNLTVQSDPSQQQFALIYGSESSAPHFVVAHFPDQAALLNASPRLEVTGEILVDSQREVHLSPKHETTLKWGGRPRAIVGVGHFRWRE